MAKLVKAGADRYANVGYGTVTESAANTLTFSEINTNVSIFDRVAWVIQRIEWYFPAATRALLLAADDLLEMALCSSDKITTLGLNNPSVIDVYRFQFGDVVPGMPIIRDWSMLPGGGKIITPKPLFVGGKGTSIAGAGTYQCRFLFTVVELSDADALELLHAYRVVE